MATAVEFVPKQHETEKITAHVLWMTTGLSCEGDSVAMTSATNPSLEDIIHGIIPGMPRVVIHTPVLAYENGAELVQSIHYAARANVEPVLVILAWPVPSEIIDVDGHGLGSGQNCA